MKKLLLITVATLSFSTAAQAQGPGTVVTLLNNLDGALNGATMGLQDAALAYIDGDITNTFNNFEQGQSGFVTDLAADTPAEALAVPYNELSRATYDALVPLYQQLDGPSMQVADALSPVGDPLAQAIGGFNFELNLDFAKPALPGGNDLGLAELPLGSLDPSTATALLNGANLPGL